MIVGITGSIGSGKSSVCQYVKSLGLPVVDADVLSRDLLKLGGEAYHKTIELFGADIVQQNGEIDRKKLAKLIFSQPEAKQNLESILHPVIRQRMLKETKVLISNGERLIFWEVPLLFETNFHTECDVTVCVVANESDIIRRVMIRSNMTKAEVSARLKSQMSVKMKQELADYVIVNDSTLHTLYDKIDELIKELKSKISKY